ncbi:hypothetical protein FQN57_006455 [Myotisia sp. PD_48]|nr:hypothetical protein FQN57_006455 [Myotisia sp. PD_48]
MSPFGVSVGDIIAIGRICWATYLICKSAPSEYREALNELSTLYVILKEIEDEALDENSAINRYGGGQRGSLFVAIVNLKPTLLELEALAREYSGLGKGKKRLWERVRFGVEQVESLRTKLIFHVNAINSLRTGISSLAIVRIETILNDIKKDIRSGMRPPTVLSAPTEVSSVGVSSWRELEAELIEDGISQIEIEENRDSIQELMADVARLLPNNNNNNNQEMVPIGGNTPETSSFLEDWLRNNNRVYPDPTIFPGGSEDDGLTSVSRRVPQLNIPRKPVLNISSSSSNPSNPPGMGNASNSYETDISNPGEASIENDIKLGDMDRNQHGEAATLRWPVRHIFDHFKIPIAADIRFTCQYICFPIDIKRITCDCTPRPIPLMESFGLLAGFREGEVIMEIPTVTTAPSWILGISRHGFLGYFYTGWLGDLTASDQDAVNSFPLDRFRSKKIVEEHRHSYPHCPITSDLFTEVIRQYLEFRVMEEPSGYLQASICHIHILAQNRLPCEPQKAAEFISSCIQEYRRPNSNKEPVPYCTRAFVLNARDYFLSPKQKSAGSKCHHPKATSVCLARYAQLAITSKLFSNAPIVPSSSGLSASSDPSRETMSLEILPPKESPVLGKNMDSILSRNKKAMAKDFELVRVCIDNFLLREFAYDVGTKSFVSMPQACNLVAQRH